MNTFSIKTFFSIMCIIIFGYIFSFSIYEIKNNNNKFGGIFTLIITFIAIIFSNIVSWIN